MELPGRVRKSRVPPLRPWCRRPTAHLTSARIFRPGGGCVSRRGQQAAATGGKYKRPWLADDSRTGSWDESRPVSRDKRQPREQNSIAGQCIAHAQQHRHEASLCNAKDKRHTPRGPTGEECEGMSSACPPAPKGPGNLVGQSRRVAYVRSRPPTAPHPHADTHGRGEGAPPATRGPPMRHLSSPPPDRRGAVEKRSQEVARLLVTLHTPKRVGLETVMCFSCR